VPPPAPPASAPAGVRVAVQGPTTATVAWDRVPSAASYQVQYRDVGHTAWMDLDSFFLSENAAATTMPLVTLAEDTTYVVRVRATNAGGTTDFSPGATFTTEGALGEASKYPTVGLEPEAVPFRLRDGTEWRLWDPFVLYDEDDDLYKVWYTVWGGSEPGFYGNRVMGVGYAWSVDGLDWTRQPGGHVLVPTPGTWDQDGLETVSVVKVNGQFYMWYLGKNYRPYRLQIGLATSPDGVRWTKHPGNPVLSPEQAFEGQNVKEPSVLWDEEAGLFKMWYNGMEGRVVRVGYATSPDGVTWTKLEGPVNGAGSAGWNHVHVVKAPAGGYQMYFLIAYSVYEAWSADGVHDWTLNPNGPVLRARTVNHTWNGAKHDFERLLAYGSPTVVFRDGKIRLYHMRTSTTATEYGDDSMRFGLAIGAAGGGGRIYVPVARTRQAR